VVNSSINLITHEAFDKAINITLFNDIIHFVMLVTDLSPLDKTKAKRELSDHVIWLSEANETDFQEKYQFRYFGEMLERYESRFGSDLRDLRAIALALAYAQPVLSANMFVGPQQKSFVKKVRECAGGDIYLNGALYLIDMAQKIESPWLTEREGQPFDKTEEILFFLSLYPQIETGYTQMKTELLRLLGVDRTIPVIHNIGLYCWLVRQCHPSIKGDRKKDAVLFKALAVLPTAFVKEDSPQHKALLAHGYTSKEIIYANYAVLHYPTIFDSLEFQSVITEKIAVSFCKMILADPDPQADDTYELLEYTLRKYIKFPIKCNGFKGIWEAVEENGWCQCPQTFIRLIKIVDWSDVFRFDIFDSKWDVLATKLSPEKYQKFFDKQMLFDTRNADLNQNDVQNRMDIYKDLTGTTYIQTFDSDRYRWDNFSLLVKSKCISLEELFLLCLSREYGKGMIDHIWTFVRGIESREAFEFFRWLFSEHKQNDIVKVFESSYTSRFCDELYEGRKNHYWGYDRKDISVKRDFLTQGENRLVLDWLDNWIYLYRTSAYIDFTVCVLLDEFASSLIPLVELREMYNLIAVNAASELKEHELRELRTKFLTEAELHAEAEAENLRKQEQERVRKKAEKEDIYNKFEELFDGTYQSVVKFLDVYRYSWDEKQRIAHEAVIDSFDRIYQTAGVSLTNQELSHFFKTCSVLTSTNTLRLALIKPYIQAIEEKEAAA
jgi:hypothetical protein